MPIEFFCPGCGNLMRTPSDTAGRKGRCPTCQLKVQIPACSVAATSPGSAVIRTANAATTSGKVPDPIRFACGSCGRKLSIPATNAGKMGQCPHCGELMSIPRNSPVRGARWKGAPKPPSASSPERTAISVSKQEPELIKAGSEKIEFLCSSCHEVVRVGVAAAGKKGQCPRCQAVIQIPLKSTSVFGLQPIPSDRQTASPRPHAKPTAPTPGLTPLDGLDALSPLEPLGLLPIEPVGSEAFSDDLFGGDLFGPSPINAGSPFANDLNPYSAPRAAPAIPMRARNGGRSGAEIATMISGGCLVAYAMAQIILVTISLFSQSVATLNTMDHFRRQGVDEAYATGIVAGQIMAVVLSGIVMLTILAGGIQMIRFKVWGLCLAACILTMMPCNCFCVLGLPIGIWGIIMLSLGSVRSAFH